MDEKLTLNPLEAVTVTSGENSIVGLTVVRQDIGEVLSVKIEDLPAGLEVLNVCSIPAGQTQGTLRLGASAGLQASAGHEVRVEITSSSGKSTSQTLRIDIKAERGARVGSEKVILHPESLREPRPDSAAPPRPCNGPSTEPSDIMPSVDEELAEYRKSKAAKGRPLGEYADLVSEAPGKHDFTGDTTVIDTSKLNAPK